MARYTTEAEVRLLQKYAKQAKVGIVEIGVLDGETTKMMSLNSTAPIYGIDPIIGDSMDQNLIGSQDQILNNMSHYKDFKFYKDFSYNVSPTWENKFDFIFIDGDHQYDAVKRDFEEWFSLLEIGGYIAFHDSGTVTSIPADFKGWEGCIQLVEELKTSITWIENVDTINVFQKV